MNAYIRKAGLGLACLALLAAVGCNRGPGNVAVVNGEAITEEDFSSYLKVKPEVQIILQNGEVVNARVAETLGFQALQDLVRQRIILQLAKDMKVMPTEQDVIKEVEFQRKRDQNFTKRLMEQGLTLDQIKESLKVDLARERLLTRSITVKPEDVEAYIKNNPNQFTEPAMVDALWIFVKDDRGRRDVERALQAGSSFSTVAVRYSQAPNASENGGAFPQRVISQVPSQEVQKLLTETTEGKETNWVRLQDGWAKFQVQDRTAAKKMEIGETEREWLKRQLAVRQGLQANDLDKRLVDKLRESKIDVSVKELKGPWEAAMDRLEKATADSKANPQSPTQGASPAQTENNQGGNN